MFRIEGGTGRDAENTIVGNINSAVSIARYGELSFFPTNLEFLAVHEFDKPIILEA